MRLLVFAVIGFLCLARRRAGARASTAALSGHHLLHAVVLVLGVARQARNSLYVSKPARAGARLSRLRNWRPAKDRRLACLPQTRLRMTIRSRS